VLAAGGSSRFGSPKQLARLNGETLVRRAAQAAQDAGANPVIVVLGASAKDVASELADMPNVTCVTNPDWKMGLGSSLAVGLRAVLHDGDCDGALVTLVDQPLVDGAALASLIAAFDDDHRVVASLYDGVIGVPALFARQYLEELTTITGDSGAGSWLRARSSIVTGIPMQKAAVDIDTPNDPALHE
jgi:molybdenum cofactor cytidylyltransferase